ncbi:MAG: hypothetical protein U0V74_16720 [Chitinophagales bacterium]
MEILHIALYIFYLALFLWLISRLNFFTSTGLQRDNLWTFFLLKVVAGVALTLVYTVYYTDQSKADIYRYFNDSKVISPLLWQHPKVWFSVITGIGLNNPENFQYIVNTQYFSHPSQDTVTNNQLIIRLISICNYFSFSNIYINTLFFSFFSFVGLTGIYHALKKYFAEFPQALCLPLFLIPSVIFWGSGLLKEAPVFFFLGLFFYAFTPRSWVGRIIMLAVSVLALVYIRPPLFIALVPAVAAYLLFYVLKAIAKPSIKWMVFAALLIVYGFGFMVAQPKVISAVIDKRYEFIELGRAENPGSRFAVWTDAISPKMLYTDAFVDGALRPFIWSAANKIELLFGIEQSLLWLFILFLLLRYFKLPEAEKRPIIAFSLVFALVFYWIVGASVPIMGAIVHYRVLATPFLLISILGVVNLCKFKYDVNRLTGLKI